MKYDPDPRSPRVRTRYALSLLLFLLALPVFAARSAAQQPGLAALRSALESRLAAGPAVEEAEPLGQALARLTAYTGLAGSYSAIDQASPGAQGAAKRDIDRLLEAAQRIQDSETQDLDVRFHAAALRNVLDAFGQEARQVATGLVSLLAVERNREIVNMLVMRGDTERAEGLSAWPADFGAGARKLVRAAFLRHGAAAFGARQQLIEAIDDPVDLGLDPSVPIVASNSMPTAGQPFQISPPFELTRPVPELTVAVRATSMDQVAFLGSQGGTMRRPPQVTLGSETFLDVQPGQVLPPIELMVEPFTEETVLAIEGMEPGIFGEESNMAPFFGHAVDIDGDTAVIGSPWFLPAPVRGVGFISIRERNEGGFHQWGEVARFYGPFGFGGDPTEFGYDVAISGNRVVVGVPKASFLPGVGLVGAVHVYERSPEGTWAQVATLHASDSDEYGPANSQRDRFGAAVDISGDQIVVGAPTSLTCDTECPTGKAYVFSFDPGTGTWLETGKLLEKLPPPFEIPLGFGEAVAIDGDILAVGAPGEGGFGLVFLYERNGFFSPDWSFSSFLEAKGEDESEFGAALALDGSEREYPIVVVGAPGHSFATQAQAGLVEVYEGEIIRPFKAPFYRQFNLTKTLSVLPRAGDRFGTSVAISKVDPLTGDPANQMIVVGAPGREKLLPPGPTDAGSVFLFVRGHAPGCPPVMPLGGWGLLARRSAAQPEFEGNFGFSVAVDSPLVPGFLPPASAEEAMATTLQDARAFPTGSGNTVLVGEQSYAVLPGGAQFFSGMDPIKAGEYQLTIDLDPFDRILEVGGAGGTPAAEPAGANQFMGPSVIFCVEALDAPDLRIDSVELTPLAATPNRQGERRGIINTDQKGNQLTSATLNVRVALTGEFEGPLSGTMLRTYVEGAVGGTIQIPGTIAGKLFDEALGQYVDLVTLPDLVMGETLDLSFDVKYERPILGSGNYPSGNSKVVVRVEVLAPRGVTDIDSTNNLFPPAAEPAPPKDDYSVFLLVECDTQGSFETQMGNDDFNVRADFQGSLALSPDLDEIEGHGFFPDADPGCPVAPGLNQAIGGASASLTGGVALTVLGYPMPDLFRARALVERDPMFEYCPLDFPIPGTAPDGYGFAALDLEVFDLFSPGFTRILYAVGPYDTIDLQTIPPDLNDQIEEALDNDHVSLEVNICDGGFVVTLGISVSDEFPAQDDDQGNPLPCPGGDCPGEKTFYPGGYPVKFRALATASLGVDFVLDVTDRLKFSVEPNIGIEAEVGLEIGNCDILCVGAEGQITLIEDRFSVAAGIGLEERVGAAGSGLEGESAIIAGSCITITNQITILKGKIVAFAIYPWFRWCSFSTFFGDVWYPCGFYLKRSELDIVSWKGIEVDEMQVIDPITGMTCTAVTTPAAITLFPLNYMVTSPCGENTDCE